MPRALGKFFATIALPLETDDQIHGHHGIRRPRHTSHVLVAEPD